LRRRYGELVGLDTQEAAIMTLEIVLGLAMVFVAVVLFATEKLPVDLVALVVMATLLLHRRGKLVSDLNFAIYEKFNRQGIVTPFPQRDVHLRGEPPR